MAESERALRALTDAEIANLAFALGINMCDREWVNRVAAERPELLLAVVRELELRELVPGTYIVSLLERAMKLVYA